MTIGARSTFPTWTSVCTVSASALLASQRTTYAPESLVPGVQRSVPFRWFGAGVNVALWPTGRPVRSAVKDDTALLSGSETLTPRTSAEPSSAWTDAGAAMAGG